MIKAKGLNRKDGYYLMEM